MKSPIAREWRASVGEWPKPGWRNVSNDLHRLMEAVLFAQSEALDSKNWQGYIDMFDTTGVYWMPADSAQENWDSMPSIFAEDRDLMTLRMKRVLHPRAWSMAPEWKTSHVVSNISVYRAESAPDSMYVQSRFYLAELRRDEVRHLAGRYRHEISNVEGTPRIQRQRVDLLTSKAPFDYVLQIWV